MQNLETLLGESIHDASERARTSFDRQSSGRPLILFGAGGLGRRTLAGLRQLGVEPVAFADNNRRIPVDGLSVFSAEEVAARFGKTATFVITIWGSHSTHRMARSFEQLKRLGCDSITHFGYLYWKHAEAFLPYYPFDLPQNLLTNADKVRAVYALMADDQSRKEFVRQVRLRLWMDFDGCSLPVPQEEYFPDDLFAVQPGEVIVDCGAFDGDTLRAFARRCPEFGRIISLEPDPANFSKLCACREALPNGDRVTCLCLAAGSERGRACFVASGSEVSRLGESGFEVEIAPLDEILRNEKPTYIKMDVEGAEPGVLAGCIETIRVHTPILAISVYHCPDHLWTLPLQVRAMTDGYRFYLRPHDEQGIGLACYAVPESRHHHSV